MDARVALAGLALLALFSDGVTSAAVDQDRFTIEPNPVAVHAFFNGGTVRVRGTVDPENSVIVVITGRTVDEHFNRKGRIGPLWATTGKVAISDVPCLHLVASPAPVSTLLRRDDIEKCRLDIEALIRRARIEPDGPDRELLLGEYLKLKQQQGVVAVFEQAVRIGGTPPARSFDAEIPWPVTAPVGTYRVAVLHVRAFAVMRQEVQTLEVKYVGIPRFVSQMASERSLVYGIVSVIIALGVGLAMGVLFKRRPAGH
jgi:hypothetical protein